MNNKLMNNVAWNMQLIATPPPTKPNNYVTLFPRLPTQTSQQKINNRYATPNTKNRLTGTRANPVVTPFPTKPNPTDDDVIAALFQLSKHTSKAPASVLPYPTATEGHIFEPASENNYRY